MAKKTDTAILQSVERCEHAGLLLSPKQENNVRACRRRVASGLLVEPFPRLFARSECWNELKPSVRPYQIIRTLSRKHPTWLFCSFSAACIYGLPVSLPLLSHVHLAAHTTSHSGTHHAVARHKLVDPDITHVMGVPVTSLEQTIVDCLCHTSFADGLAIADAAMRMLNVSNCELYDLVCKRGEHRKGIVHARAIAQHANALSGSGGESIARARMIQLGFLEPELQVAIADPVQSSGNYFVDYLWHLFDGRTIVGEFDGAEKYTLFSTNLAESALRSMMRERQREAHLTLACDAIVRFSYPDLMNPQAFTVLLSSYGIPRHKPLKSTMF